MGNEINKGKWPSRGNRRREVTHIREVVEAILTAPGSPVDFADMKLWKLWDGLVGPEIASHARPSSIKRGTLVVKVSDSVWLQELEFKAYEIRERINGALQREAVRKIRFRVGEPKAKPVVQ
jgi:predicted nucleic acid-binding Zn ribbon protein